MQAGFMPVSVPYETVVLNLALFHIRFWLQRWLGIGLVLLSLEIIATLLTVLLETRALLEGQKGN